MLLWWDRRRSVSNRILPTSCRLMQANMPDGSRLCQCQTCDLIEFFPLVVESIDR